MNRSEQFEIERLVSEIADEGASCERIGRLDDLLRGRSDLREHYSRVMALHMLLDFEFDLSMQQLQPIVPRHERETPRSTSLVDNQCMELSTRIGRDISSNVRQIRNWRWPRWAVIASAAAVSALLVGFAAWRGLAPQELAEGSRSIRVDATGIDQPLLNGQTPQAGLVVRDAQSLRLISRLTKTPSLTSLLLPRCPGDVAPGVMLCSGTAWMERSPTQRERGYVVALAPGCQMDVYVYTDASFQNGLTVVELDDDGRMTGGAISFSNLEKRDSTTTERRIGCIGNYSEFNDRSTPKYYLLTGTHRTPKHEADEMWRLSDFTVQYNSSDIMVIGWDDNGYVEDETGFAPDRDFNDVRAVLRFSRPAGSLPQSATVRYAPDIERDLPLADAKVTGFPLEVKPGEALVMMVSSSARLPNTFRVVDSKTRQIIWLGDAPPADADGPQDEDRGVYVIRNFGPSVRHYEIQAQHVSAGSEPERPQWSDSPYRTFEDGDRSVIIGFEDNITVPVNVDWNDIRVYARWLSD
jgi:hypothetical protein